MNQISFAERMSLKPADVIKVPKSQWNVVVHYVVYWGWENGIHFYLDNNNQVGVRWLTEEQFMIENPTYNRIQHFQGNNIERGFAIQRAVSMVGQPYDLKTFNCENYANYVQSGTSYSKQVDNTAGGLLIGGIALGIIALAGLSKG